MALFILIVVVLLVLVLALIPRLATVLKLTPTGVLLVEIAAFVIAIGAIVLKSGILS